MNKVKVKFGYALRVSCGGEIDLDESAIEYFKQQHPDYDTDDFSEDDWMNHEAVIQEFDSYINGRNFECDWQDYEGELEIVPITTTEGGE